MLTVKEAVKVSGLSQSVVYRRIREGAIEAIKDPNGSKFRYLIPESEVAKLKPRRGGLSPRKLTDDEVQEIRRRARTRQKSGESQKQLAEEFGISRQYINDIIHHKVRVSHHQKDNDIWAQIAKDLEND